MTSDLLTELDAAPLMDVVAEGPGPAGSLPLEPADLLHRPSGDLFGWTLNVAMGWKPGELRRPEVLILGTQGGIRQPDGTPLALGYHTGHWEIGLLMEAAARALRTRGFIPFAAYCSDPCDGRAQGTTGMMDSLPYRNDAAVVLGRLIRTLPNRAGVLGVGTCDKGLPAMMMAVAAARDLPGVIVPGGVTLPATDGEDAGKAQTIGARYAHGLLSLEEAAELGCRACASPGGGCQFLGTAATSQVVAEALGLAVTHGALAPSGQPIWTDVAVRSTRALERRIRASLPTRAIVTDAAVRNAMTVFAAFGGSTNLLLHLPAVAHAAGVHVPTAADWADVNRRVPRLVDSLPNGPHPTVRVYLAGGVPEVMLHLRNAGLLDLSALTAGGEPLEQALAAWETSHRRQVLRERLAQLNVSPDDVIMSPSRARERGLTSTISFLRGNLCPEGAVVKSTAIDRSTLDADGVYRLEGRARVFVTERAAIAAVKSTGADAIRPGDVLVLCGRGPLGAGMEEVYQVTAALKHLPIARHVALITDARFSGVSTGPCVGHISPEALAGGPLGKVRDGDHIRVVIDTRRLAGSVDLMTPADTSPPRPWDEELARRPLNPSIAPDEAMPADTRLWAALQSVSGGAWAGSVYDVDRIEKVLAAGLAALARQGDTP